MKILTDDDWRHVRVRFEDAFPGFQGLLKINFSDLTSAETRLLLLHKLNFSSPEIAGALGISIGSVCKSRYRMAEKLGIADTNDLDEFVRQFE